MGVGAGWYYNDVSGDVVHASLITSLGEGVVPGWHGPYATEALAMAHTGVKGATAHANETVTGGAASAAGTTISSVTGTTGVTQFLGKLTSREMWVRIMKVIIGGIMIIVGLAQLTGAGKVIGNLPKVVPV